MKYHKRGRKNPHPFSGRGSDEARTEKQTSHNHKELREMNEKLQQIQEFQICLIKLCPDGTLEHH